MLTKAQSEKEGNAQHARGLRRSGSTGPADATMRYKLSHRFHRLRSQVLPMMRPKQGGMNVKDLKKINVRLEETELDTYAELIITKNKYGPAGFIPALFFGETQRFETPDGLHDETTYQQTEVAECPF